MLTIELIISHIRRIFLCELELESTVRKFVRIGTRYRKLTMAIRELYFVSLTDLGNQEMKKLIENYVQSR